ncbi:MAG TPA: hypothetical protein DEA44_17565 [Firmicutes bacterium]|nr:hypothetical protein [Bacillota bacterium]
MTKRYALTFFGSAIILICLLAGYGIYVNVTSSAHVAKMTAAQYIRVKSAPVLFREITPAVYFPVVNIYSPNMLDVHFQLDGILTSIFVKPGDRVRTGQLLGEIVNNELLPEVLQAEGKVRAAEANAVQWNNTLRRYQILAAQNAISRQKLDEAVASLSAAEGELDSARAYHGAMVTRLGKQQIMAPCDGDVLQVYHAPGAVVRNGDSLVMIGELASLYFRNIAASDMLEQLQPLTGEFKLAVQRSGTMEKVYASALKGDAGGGNDFDLQIAEISPPLDTPAQYRTVMYKINNASGLLEPGTYYQVKIYSTSKRRALCVPRDAIMGDAEPFVFVVGPDSRLEQRPVRTGIRDDEYVEVQAGLAENETVVVVGKYAEFVPGMKVHTIQAP